MIKEYYHHWALAQSNIVCKLGNQGLEYLEIESALYTLFIEKGEPKLKGYEEFRDICNKLIKKIIKKLEEK